MGFIQPILIASAALGVLASTSELKSRASHADLNINDVSDVAAHFSDVVPTDWAYQALSNFCLLYTSPSPRDRQKSRMPSSA